MRPNVTSIVLGSIAVLCYFTSGFFRRRIIVGVNRSLPVDQQIPDWWMYTEKYTKLRREYKRRYPLGRVHIIELALQISGAILFFLAVAAAGFFR
jgi:hypothetical protein